MATKRLKRLGFTPSILERLNKHRLFTCRDVLSRTDIELLKLLGLGILTVQDIMKKASGACAPLPMTLLSYEKKRNSHSFPGYLPTSLGPLDRVLHGGLSAGTITEIAGPSGCGKTQFSIMLSVLAARRQHSSGGGVIYIDTEGAFSAERLVEVAENRFPDVFTAEDALVDLSSRIHVYLETTCASLLFRLEHLEEDIITKRVCLIIIDSIASLVRKEYDSHTGKNMVDRTNLLTKEAAILKYIGETFNIPVVVTNQVTTRYTEKRGAGDPTATDGQQKPDGEAGVSLDGESSYVTAALGNTWSHSVNTRLIVQYLDGAQRQVMVAKSPVAPFSCFVYLITARGIELQEGGGRFYEGTDPGLQHIRVRSAVRQDAFVY